MSRPPEVIRIKRKRDDDSPLAFLELDAEGHKRARSTNNYLYKRHIMGSTDDVPIPKPIPQNSRPIIQTSAPGNEIRYEKQLLTTKSPKTPKDKDTDDGGPQRTFHISKVDTERLKSYSSQSSLTGMKRRHNTVVFVERDIRKMRVVGGSSVAVQTNSPTKSPQDQDQVDIPVPATPSTQQRRQVAIPVGRLPPGERPQKPKTLDLDRMADVMSQWAKEVTDTIPAVNATAQSPTQVKRPLTRFRSKSKPKPATEEKTASTAGLAPAAPVTTGQPAQSAQNDSDSDYVEEEYHIVDLRAVPSDVPRHMIGRLVIDSDEQEYFYEEKNMQSTEYDSDESDENAENHYGNDYPDQELESDLDDKLGGIDDGVWGVDTEDYDQSMAMSDYGDEDWTQIKEADYERDEDTEERDAKILERIRRFNQAVNKHGGY